MIFSLDNIIQRSIWFDVTQRVAIKSVTVQVVIKYTKICIESTMDHKRFITLEHQRRYF